MHQKAFAHYKTNSSNLLKIVLICNMRNLTIVSFVLVATLSTANVVAQTKKIDTTASFGDVSYHVTCNNKKEEDNMVSVSPKGFKNTVRDVTLPIRGRLTSIIVDDLNDDGFPDLLLVYFTGANHEIGNVYGISSVDNASLMPVSFPDLYNDPKLRVGYKGHDEFTIVAGSLLRSFPIFKDTDTTTATGGTRVIQYKIIPMPERPDARTFKLLRSYEK
jgi:hypothetical protein